MMYVSQIIMLYTLNLYSAVCQWYLSKTGRKNFYETKKLCKDWQHFTFSLVFDVKQLDSHICFCIQSVAKDVNFLEASGKFHWTRDYENEKGQ